MMLSFEKYYHIYNHANGDDNLFRERKNYHFFLKKYKQHIHPIADTIAWCLMPNHFHLLVKIKSETEITTLPKFQTLDGLEQDDKTKFLSKQFANFFSSYTQAFNKVYGRRGSLFLKNFKRKEISDNQYLRNLILYIHLNPVKHAFTNSISKWEWVSYQSFPIAQKEMLSLLFNDEENYRQVHQERQANFKDYSWLESELT